MAISSYLKRCGYQQNELKNVLYLIPKTATKKVHIDGDEAYVEYSGDTLSIIKIKGNNLAFQEDTSFDDRFRFDKTITLTVDGYITFKDFYSKYYAIVEDKSGTFWMVNADFPSYITYTYTLNDGENKTDLVFYAASNIPTIKLANFNPDNAEECETYMPYGIKNLKLLEKNKSKLSTYRKYAKGDESFNVIEAIDGTYELTEEFNGETYATQLSFSIPLSEYKASWHVKLLEFEKNKYCGFITLKNSKYKAFLGYNAGLFPSYAINGDIVTITLTENSNYGMVFDDYYAVFDTNMPNTVSIIGPKCKTYTFESTCDWVVTYSPSNIHISPLSGKADKKYNLKICNDFSISGEQLSYFEISGCSATYSANIFTSNIDCVNRWVAIDDPYCKDCNKVQKHKLQYMCPGDTYWHDVAPLETSAVTIEECSSDCGLKEYFYIKSLEDDNRIELINRPYSANYDLKHSFDKINWSTGSVFTLNKDQIVYFNKVQNYVSETKIRFNNSKYYEIGGNVETFLGAIDECSCGEGSWYQFRNLFSNDTKLVSAKNLKFPTKFMDISSCYRGMFSGCTSLVEAPAILPVLNLADRCYEFMFQGCTSLTTPPVLPATVLSKECYRYMFQGCTSLVTATDLPATTLAESSYWYMFSGCTSLTEIPLFAAKTLDEYSCGGMFCDCTSLITLPELPATTLAPACYWYMFDGCTSLTTVPELSATTLAQECYMHMFQGCTSLTEAPLLPATELAPACYSDMFEGCTSLTTPPVLSATTLAERCYEGMLNGCTSLTVSPELPATTLANECYHQMFWGCASLTEAPLLPATELAEGCYSDMFVDCTSLTKAPVLPATTLAESCYEGMFFRCYSLTEAPLLPATTLANECYSQMFAGCTSLRAITCLAEDISAPNCTFHWVNSLPNSGVFTKAEGMTDWALNSINGIPSGWTITSCTGYRTVPSGETCVGFNKFNNMLQQISYDSGSTWETKAVAVYNLIEENSEDCGYVGPENAKYKLTLSNSSYVYAECDQYNMVYNSEISPYKNDIISIEINDCVNTIGTRAFYQCSGLTGVIMPNSITEIWAEAFKYCTNLTYIDIPSATTIIRDSAFMGCSSIKNINIPSGVTIIEALTFALCSGLTSVNFSSGLTEIGYRAFEGCSGLTVINLPIGITKIDDNAFTNCSSLVYINIPSGTTNIGYGAFQGCKNLIGVNVTGIDIPDTVTIIEDFAFYGCSGLKSITLYSSTPPTIGSETFANTADCSIKVPGESLNLYKTSPIWENYADRIFGHNIQYQW